MHEEAMQMQAETRRKTAIIVLSDPGSSTDEALGRVFNAMAAAYDFKRHGGEVKLLFQGAATRWPEQLSDVDHPAHELFRAVSDTIVGASHACAVVFGADEGVGASGLELLSDNAVPGTNGLPSLRALADAGFDVLTF